MSDTPDAQNSAPPEPFGALPSAAQLAWHKMEYFSLIHYGLNTYTEQEWGYGDTSPSIFNPSNLDTDQWAQVAAYAGMKGIILVTKHHDGFCLWPSKHTEYSVKSSPWKSGGGDVIADLSRSCKKYGLKMGLYLSPWDRNHAQYGRPEYVAYYYKQLEELLTEYGDIFEFWIDGANGGDGYYGGANETRSIERKSYYGYEQIFATVQKHQPNAVIFSDIGPGVRWVGNEDGIVQETNWNTLDITGRSVGEPDPAYHQKLGCGDPGAQNWLPAEANTTLSWPKAWVYHSDKRPRNLPNLMELYYTTIGRGSPLNMGIAVDQHGQIRELDRNALWRFREQIEREFAVNFVRSAELCADDVRGYSYGLQSCIDGNDSTYWATNDGVQSARLHIDFKRELILNRLLLQEHIELGQRITSFVLENAENGEILCSGTTVGYKRALRFAQVATSRLRLVLHTDAPCLTLSSLGIYNAPSL